MYKQMQASLTVLIVALSLTACSALPGNTAENTNELRASGTIAAQEVEVASELGGVAREILVEEGMTVQAGDVLFRLDDALLQAQRAQAEAALQVAQATQGTAEAGLNAARIQQELTLNAARLQDSPSRAAAWLLPAPAQFSLPAWYFSKAETMTAAQAEVEAAQTAYETEQTNLSQLIDTNSSGEVVAAEERLARAQATFLVAQTVLSQAVSSGVANLQDSAQLSFDSAETELEAAQRAYDGLLSSTVGQDILEARARTAVARARCQSALDALNQMLTGDQSLQVLVAKAAVDQATAAVAQAEAGVAQAAAALHVVETQMAKIEVRAPAAGVVLARNLEAGEVVAPGSTVIVLGQLQEVNLTVYIPEDQYGRINLGDEVRVTVDSFSGQGFVGTVVRIADEAEFTPRNVQTVDGRRSTVYGVDLHMPNPELKLKPGMPADVVFDVTD